MTVLCSETFDGILRLMVVYERLKDTVLLRLSSFFGNDSFLLLPQLLCLVA